ncbi:hypothetical protein BDY24DRAFT_372568 [Mrakia frigida]|uniref:uncharacterized protein n=1 Tax=Mrakia frigida TaxID=29902 RepID=UPI003FCC2474
MFSALFKLFTSPFSKPVEVEVYDPVSLTEEINLPIKDMFSSKHTVLESLRDFIRGIQLGESRAWWTVNDVLLDIKRVAGRDLAQKVEGLLKSEQLSSAYKVEKLSKLFHLVQKEGLPIRDYTSVFPNGPFAAKPSPSRSMKRLYRKRLFQKARPVEALVSASLVNISLLLLDPPSPLFPLILPPVQWIPGIPLKVIAFRSSFLVLARVVSSRCLFLSLYGSL